ncbi:MAG: hypothetical protein ABIL58_04965 [Pseudomonadota bacterium]
MTDSIHRKWHHMVVGPPGGRAAETAAEVWADDSSAWFDGHFPGIPVLPGIAQLAMVRDVIAGALGSDIRVSEIRRIRFKQKIVPGERLTVSVSPREAAGTFSFRILAQDAPACTGTMVVENSDPA